MKEALTRMETCDTVHSTLQSTRNQSLSKNGVLVVFGPEVLCMSLSLSDEIATG